MPLCTLCYNFLHFLNGKYALHVLKNKKIRRRKAVASDGQVLRVSLGTSAHAPRRLSRS
jgi:hypothetical protein